MFFDDRLEELDISVGAVSGLEPSLRMRRGHGAFEASLKKEVEEPRQHRPDGEWPHLGGDSGANLLGYEDCFSRLDLVQALALVHLEIVESRQNVVWVFFQL